MSLLSVVLLQIDSNLTSAADTVVTPAETLSLVDLLFQGGILMIPLALCSIILVYVFIERLLAIRKASATDPMFMATIREQLTDGNLPGARSLAKKTDGPIARMVEKGISRIGKPIDMIEKSMEATGKLEVYKMEKNLGILNTISKIAPMFGFLGTIAGMIILFFNIQHQGFSLEGIAGGIYTKMVTSAVGLIIGLLAYVAYDILNAQVNKNVNKMEVAAAEFLDILQEPTK